MIESDNSVRSISDKLTHRSLTKFLLDLHSLTTTATSYCLSKLALNGATIMLAQSLKPKHIIINAMCPGWVRTDMGGASADRSPEQGADTAIWLATEAPRSETGKFWRDRKSIAL